MRWVPSQPMSSCVVAVTRFAFEVCEEAEDGVAVEGAACAGAGTHRVAAVAFLVGLECCGEAVEVGNALGVASRKVFLLFLLLGRLFVQVVRGRVLAGDAREGESDEAVGDGDADGDDQDGEDDPAAGISLLLVAAHADFSPAATSAAARRLGVVSRLGTASFGVGFHPPHGCPRAISGRPRVGRRCR